MPLHKVKITSLPPLEAEVGQLYTYKVVAESTEPMFEDLRTALQGMADTWSTYDNIEDQMFHQMRVLRDALIAVLVENGEENEPTP